MHKIEKHSGKIVVIESIKGKYVFIGVLFKISKLIDTFFAISMIRYEVLIFYVDCEFWMPR